MSGVKAGWGVEVRKRCSGVGGVGGWRGDGEGQERWSTKGLREVGWKGDGRGEGAM